MAASGFEFSNFETVPGGLLYEGIRYPTSEHAYQASKTADLAERQRIAKLQRPGDAKRAGRQVTQRPDFDPLLTMMQILAVKFRYEPFHSRLRQSTGPIVEWNTWHDNTWGDCICGRPACEAPGRNQLGLILETLRTVLAL